MRVHGFAKSVLVASLTLAACGDEAPSLVGRWEPVEQFDSGFAGVLDLNDDGTFASGMVVQVSFPYSIEGSTLVLRNGEGEQGGDVRVQHSIEGDELLFDGVRGRRRVDVATPGVHPIVGVWTYEHDTRAAAYERFGEDGIFDLRIPMAGLTEGRFTVSGSNLMLERQGERRVCSFERGGGLLRLTEKGGRPNVLRLVPRWYPLAIDDAEIARRAGIDEGGTEGSLSINPKFLSFGLVRPGAPVVRSVRLESLDPSFDPSSVSVTLEGEDGAPLQWAERYSTRIEPMLGTNAVDIHLSLDGAPAGAEGSFRGVMVIQTGRPSQPQEPVRFSGVCRK